LPWYWGRMGAKRNLLLFLAVVALLGVVCWIAPPPSLACSYLDCGAANVHPAKGEIPANEFVLTYSPTRWLDGGGLIEPHLYKVAGDGGVELPLTLADAGGRLLTLDTTQALSPGDQLVLESGSNECPLPEPFRTRFTVTEPRARPAVLGTLVATVTQGPLTIAGFGGACSTEIDASYADLVVEFAPEAVPFAEVMRYQLWLDGVPQRPFADFIAGAVPPFEPLRPKSMFESWQERAYLSCDPISARFKLFGESTPGVHRARMRATFLDGTTLDTPEVEFQLRCDGADAGVADASTADAARGTRTEASTQGDADGCSVSPRSGRGSTGGLALFAACGCLLIRRRVRRPS